MQYEHGVQDLAATSFNKMKVAHPPLAFKEQQKKKCIKRLAGLLKLQDCQRRKREITIYQSEARY